jgi:hypothetical protein
MICCVECDEQKTPKMEMVGDHKHWRKSRFFPLLLFYFSYVLLFLGYEHWVVVLHGVLMLRSNVGDGALFS